MKNDFLTSSELIINPNGSIYHLQLKPHEVAPFIITVGDPDRVSEVAAHFNHIEHQHQHREFRAITGFLDHKRITVISTGIGTDNVDIVLNELDALFQIDFNTRIPKEHFTPLTIVRIGTTGTIQPDIPIDVPLVSTVALSFDGLLPFYANHPFAQPENWPMALAGVKPFMIAGNATLIDSVPDFFLKGITATMPGFYAPQGRNIRLSSIFGNNLTQLQNIVLGAEKIINCEMETAGIYALAHLLGHRAISFNAIIANRATGEFSSQPQKTINQLVVDVIAWIKTL